MAYATGRHMGRPAVSAAFTPSHVAALVHQVFAQRVVFHDGDVTLTPASRSTCWAVSAAGTQVVRVRDGGWLVLASDASHYYENMEAGRPFPIVHDVGDMLDGYDRLVALASSGPPSCPATTRSSSSATRPPVRGSRASRSASTRAASAPEPAHRRPPQPFTSANLRRHRSPSRARRSERRAVPAERAVPAARVSRGSARGDRPGARGRSCGSAQQRGLLELVGERLERGRAGLHLGAEAVVDVGRLGQQLLLAGRRGAGARLGPHLGQAVLGQEDAADLLRSCPSRSCSWRMRATRSTSAGEVAAGAAHGSAGRGQQVELLVVPQRPGGDPGLVGGVADGEQRTTHARTVSSNASPTSSSSGGRVVWPLGLDTGGRSVATSRNFTPTSTSRFKGLGSTAAVRGWDGAVALRHDRWTGRGGPAFGGGEVGTMLVRLLRSFLRPYVKVLAAVAVLQLLQTLATPSCPA